MKLRILHINTESGYRGGEIQTLRLAAELQRRGHANYLLAQRGSPLLSRADEAGIHTAAISMRGEWDLLAAEKIRKIISTFSPHIVHAHTPHAGTLALIAARGNACKVIISRRVCLPIKRNLVSRYKYNRADAILAVSSTVREDLISQKINPEKICVAEDGTDFSLLQRARSRNENRRQLGIPESAFVIGNVAHFDRHKGQRLLMEAFSEHLRTQPNANSFLLLAGEGPLLASCRVAAQQLALSQKIIFTSFRTDIENVYNTMDVFFLSTFTMLEGWSGVLTEAMGAGLPVIAVRQPVTEERIQDQVNGLLVSARVLKEWRDAINLLSSDARLRAELAARAREYALQFTVGAMTDKTEACYQQALERAV